MDKDVLLVKAKTKIDWQHEKIRQLEQELKKTKIEIFELQRWFNTQTGSDESQVWNIID
jgi:hypothetical protein